MNRGDIVQIRASDVPLPEFPAVVINVTATQLEVMSTLLAPFQHSGKFNLNDIETITVHPAEGAVEKETGFPLGAHCRTRVKVGGSFQEGKAIAGFDGVLVIERADGELITGSKSYFELAR